MKVLSFEDRFLTEDLELKASIEKDLSKYTPTLDMQYLSILTDAGSGEYSALKDQSSVQSLLELLLKYVFCVLNQNPGCIQIKEPPYSMGLMVKISYKRSLLEITLKADETIYGVLVGGQHINENNFIKSLFPIFAKGTWENNIRFHPFYNR